MSTNGTSTISSSGAARRRWLFAALIATLAATAWSSFFEDDEKVLVSARSVGAKRSDTAVRSRVEPASVSAQKGWPPPRKERPDLPLQVDALAWNGPAGGPAAAASAIPVQDKPFVGPVVPTAPAFGYALIGRLDDGQPRALLTGPLRSFDVRVGDVLDGQWRIDAVTADGLMVTWLPTDKRQRIGFKSS